MSRRWVRVVPMFVLGAILGSAAPAAELEIQLSQTRNNRGVVHFCLTRNPRHFPDCAADPDAIRRTTPATEARTIVFNDIPAGRYALSVFHDENRNRKLDTLLKIPREGFGFSRNPVIRFGPPRFDQVQFDIGEVLSRQNVRMQYLL